MFAIFKNRTLQTFILLGLYATFASDIEMEWQRGFYTISLFIKDILMWLIPITVCVFIAHTIASFEKKAFLFILILFLFESLSNMSSVWYAYGVAKFAGSSLPEVSNLQDEFSAFWRIPFSRPAWWGGARGSFIGFVLGILGATFLPQVRPVISKGKHVIEVILTKAFGKIIPIYVLGFVMQLNKSGMLSHLINNYGTLILYLLLFTFLYIFLIFMVGAKFSIIRAISDLKNLMPAGLIALSSGCSLSTMPWTIQGAAKNMKDPELAKALIPATTNIQQIGDCIANAFLCFLIYQTFFGYMPDIMTWFIFTLVFVAARFATAGITGGAIFIMLPIYQSYLNFNDEMIAVILAFNVILDPIITSCNVVANGGLAKIFENLWCRIAPSS